ncbi:hypothetical protein LEP1GSC131_3420 [Leptospira kirschneri str. 200802841]|uniref:Uncharacterized protein n=1 Tax=Leptospira kirschneri str. 200802841 TaxID=1193047 RepID=A0A828XZ17_9LEPT|nr:hypothetical protein LEP1GSC131_3420 [Leptospira kirschneri str. 200802841]
MRKTLKRNGRNLIFQQIESKRIRFSKNSSSDFSQTRGK